MDHYKEEEIPARIEKVCYKTTCDLCGGDMKEITSSNSDDTELTARWGSSWPENGSGEEIKIDMCVNCFRNELVPWLESKGCNVETKEWWY